MARKRLSNTSVSSSIWPALAQRLAAGDGEVWCVFDNTAEGAAATDGLSVIRVISDPAL
jgi:uncharacterized protein YecE (DUF72 family)